MSNWKLVIPFNIKMLLKTGSDSRLTLLKIMLRTELEHLQIVGGLLHDLSYRKVNYLQVRGLHSQGRNSHKLKTVDDYRRTLRGAYFLMLSLIGLRCLILERNNFIQQERKKQKHT
ncbi:hypothetical protein QWY82_12610 [Simiduia curdlanivorans]|uniref:Uncharacterized protein n=1 Tax=Simiduia curdlanivorans TaxID=1492769 RepID=A0ABV8V954_9GAMM|nr:hypothetical protein [Simiduia curdlanivorans]MDN3639638.1 hypothetical protein [Simiduia curdlanivorans]